MISSPAWMGREACTVRASMAIFHLGNAFGAHAFAQEGGVERWWTRQSRYRKRAATAEQRLHGACRRLQGACRRPQRSWQKGLAQLAKGASAASKGGLSDSDVDYVVEAGSEEEDGCALVAPMICRHRVGAVDAFNALALAKLPSIL